MIIEVTLGIAEIIDFSFLYLVKKFLICFSQLS